MKIKTSITLSEDIIEYIDSNLDQVRTRSEFIERALRVFIAQRKRDELNARDVEIINKRADDLNEEAEDVLSYQVVI
ncbi:hypothetical protein ACFL27_11085 [candidate division CSSED10-310 bacterium]|uniref:Ribbon-helix-helix protein CopG domain-containing protein n=1 Tax=candidate division CSSED10-310 bacterium TaxID=2855610 RepID=A0ABV6YXD3_UNCC1